MLKKRILTALVLIPLVVVFILYLPPIIFAPLSALVFLYAFAEWPRMVGYRNRPTAGAILQGLCLSIGLFLGLALFALTVMAFTLKMANISHPITAFVPSQPFWPAFIIGLWCLPVLAVFLYPKGSKYYANGPLGLSIGMLMLFIAWVSLALLQKHDPKFALYPLVLVWMADTAAYFVGKGFGRYKLAPSVSPGKTWEGVLGAVLGGLLLSFASHAVFNLTMSIVCWAMLNTIVVLFSVIGDLFESIFKRAHGLKDSGALLPGHGGLLDRIDAQLAALPVFAALFLTKMVV